LRINTAGACLITRVTTLTIPDGIDFGDLALERDPVSHTLFFDYAVLARVCDANGFAPASLSDEDISCSLIGEWYVQHIGEGGAPDDTMEQILGELSRAADNGSAEIH
jgi:hypothetical protein